MVGDSLIKGVLGVVLGKTKNMYLTCARTSAPELSRYVDLVITWLLPMDSHTPGALVTQSLMSRWSPLELYFKKGERNCGNPKIGYIEIHLKHH
jgi:hypothetical protein